MTNEEMITDLKQFIAATVKQETAAVEQRIDRVEERLTARISGVEQRLTTKIDGVELRLTAKINEVQAAIGGAMTDETERVDAELERIETNHGRRLRRLESKLA